MRPDKWWKEQEKLFLDLLIYKKKYELAYKIASEHWTLTDGPDHMQQQSG